MPSYRQAHERHAQHFLEIARAANNLYLKGNESTKRGLALFDTEWGNIGSGWQWTVDHSEDDGVIAQICMEYAAGAIQCLCLRQQSRLCVVWLETALRIAEQLGSRRLGDLLRHLGNAYLACGNVQQAIRCHLDSIEANRSLNNLIGEATALIDIGADHLVTGEFEIALQNFRQALAMIGGRNSMLECLAVTNIAIAHIQLGRIEAAIDSYKRALKIAIELGAQDKEAWITCNLALAYSALGERQSAITLSERALVIYREIGDLVGQVISLSNLSSLFGDVGDIQNAIEVGNEAVVAARSLQEPAREADALCNLAKAYWVAHQPQRAIESDEAALEIYRTLGESRQEGWQWFNLSLSLYETGQCSRAIAYAERALSILDEIGDPVAAKARKKLHEWQNAG